MTIRQRERTAFEAGVSFETLPDKLVGTLAKGSATPSVKNNETWKCINVVPVTITNFLDGAIAQRLYILGDSNTSVAHNSHIQNNTAATKLLRTGVIYKFTLIDNIWYEDVDDTAAGGGGPVTDNDRAEAVLGPDAAEVANQISVPVQIKHLDGTNYTTDLVDILVVVSDAANDREPSATATLSSGALGTMYAGSGTATGVYRSDINGRIDILVSETAAAYRYLWVVAGGNTRLFIKAKNGVHEVQFT